MCSSLKMTPFFIWSCACDFTMETFMCAPLWEAGKQAGTKKVIAYFRLNGKTQTLYAIMCYVTRCIEISWILALIEVDRTRSHFPPFHTFIFSISIWCVNRICIFSRVSFFLASTSIRNKRTGSKAHKELEAHILDNVFFFFFSMVVVTIVIFSQSKTFWIFHLYFIQRMEMFWRFY